jgi:oxygen-independent coproporphyrinogen-3 oxidase
MELHPEVAKQSGYLERIAQAGVKRVSFGLQSTDPSILKGTARHHAPHVLDGVLKHAKDLGLMTNVDVMYGGLPGETLQNDQLTFRHVFERLNPEWVTGYQTCIQEGTAEAIRYQQARHLYPDTAAILSARALLHKLAIENGYRYLGGDYFSKAQPNPNYQKSKWGQKTAVIAFGPGTYSYILDSHQGALWWSPFDTKAFMGRIRSGRLPIERTTKYTEKDIESWNAIGRLKRQQPISCLTTGLEQKFNALQYLGLTRMDAAGLLLTEKGILIEDLIYAALMPEETWCSFAEKRKSDYTAEDAKYDWFFEPEAVLKFQRKLVQQ